MSYKCPDCGEKWIAKNMPGGRFLFKSDDEPEECRECRDDV